MMDPALFARFFSDERTRLVWITQAFTGTSTRRIDFTSCWFQ